MGTRQDQTNAERRHHHVGTEQSRAPIESLRSTLAYCSRNHPCPYVTLREECSCGAYRYDVLYASNDTSRVSHGRWYPRIQQQKED